jgi:hypothetical protein
VIRILAGRERLCGWWADRSDGPHWELDGGIAGHTACHKKLTRRARVERALLGSEESIGLRVSLLLVHNKQRGKKKARGPCLFALWGEDEESGGRSADGKPIETSRGIKEDEAREEYEDGCATRTTRGSDEEGIARVRRV